MRSNSRCCVCTDVYGEAMVKQCFVSKGKSKQGVSSEHRLSAESFSDAYTGFEHTTHFSCPLPAPSIVKIVVFATRTGAVTTGSSSSAVSFLTWGTTGGSCSGADTRGAVGRAGAGRGSAGVARISVGRCGKTPCDERFPVEGCRRGDAARCAVVGRGGGNAVATAVSSGAAGVGSEDDSPPWQGERFHQTWVGVILGGQRTSQGRKKT